MAKAQTARTSRLVTLSSSMKARIRQRSPGTWQISGGRAEVFGSERLTGALLDRLTHQVHILEMNGESYRLKRSRENAVPQAPDEPVDA